MNSGMTHPFEQLVYDRFVQGIAAWDITQPPDIYAIGFFLNAYCYTDEEGNEINIPWEIELRFNTLSHYQNQIPQIPYFCHMEEAKWNTAYWLSDVTATVPRRFGPGEAPPYDELTLCDEWRANIGWAAQQFEPRLAQALHTNGILESRIGRTVPVFLYDWEDREWSVNATRAANPPGLAREAEESLQRVTSAQLAAYEVLHQEVRSLPIFDQARFWRDAWLSFVLKRPSEITPRLLPLGRNKYGVMKALAETGAAAVSLMLPLVEKCALQEQFLLREAPGHTPGRGWTQEYELTQNALAIIRKVGLASNAEVERLYVVGASLYDASMGQEWIGTHLSSVAATLHTLRPAHFPAPQTSDGDNLLLNYEEYGF